MMLPGGIDASLSKKVFAVEGAPFLTRFILLWKQRSLLPSRPRLFQDFQDFRCLGCLAPRLPFKKSPLHLNPGRLFSTNAGQESGFQHDSPSATLFPSPFDLAAFPLPPFIFVAPSRLRPSSWVKGL